MSLTDLIHGHRPLAHPAATDQAKTANRSTNSNFGHETSPSDRPATSPPAPDWTRDPQPRRLWFVRDAEGQCWSVSFTPPATYTQVQASRPNAQHIEPEEDHDPED